MNRHESRFMRIRRYTEQQIGELHDAERAAYMDSNPDGWYIAGEKYMNKIDLLLPPFWEKKVTNEERDRAFRQFFEQKAVRHAFVMLNDFTKNEMEAQHEADWYLYKNTAESAQQLIAGDTGLSAIYGADS